MAIIYFSWRKHVSLGKFIELSSFEACLLTYIHLEAEEQGTEGSTVM